MPGGGQMTEEDVRQARSGQQFGRAWQVGQGPQGSQVSSWEE